MRNVSILVSPERDLRLLVPILWLAAKPTVFQPLLNEPKNQRALKSYSNSSDVYWLTLTVWYSLLSAVHNDSPSVVVL